MYSILVSFDLTKFFFIFQVVVLVVDDKQDLQQLMIEARKLSIGGVRIIGLTMGVDRRQLEKIASSGRYVFEVPVTSCSIPVGHLAILFSEPPKPEACWTGRS